MRARQDTMLARPTPVKTLFPSWLHAKDFYRSELWFRLSENAVILEYAHDRLYHQGAPEAMGLKGDIEEVKDGWSNASAPLKVWLALSVFVSVSSIASLSEAIVRWRGFIRDGLDFYHTMVVDPFIRLMAPLDLDYSTGEVNLLIVTALFLTSATRYLVYSGKGFDRKDWFPNAIVIGWFAASAWGLGHVEMPADTLFWLYLICILGWVSLGVVVIRKNRVVYFGPTLLAVVVVVLLAAINKGLTG